MDYVNDYEDADYEEYDEEYTDEAQEGNDAGYDE